MADVDEFLPLREAAAAFRVSPDTLRRRIKSGVLAHRRMLRNRIMVRRGDVETALFGPATTEGAAASR